MQVISCTVGPGVGTGITVRAKIGCRTDSFAPSNITNFEFSYTGKYSTVLLTTQPQSFQT